MQIPKQLTVGRVKYAVHIVPTLPKYCKGYISYGEQTISVAKRSVVGYSYTKREMYGTFWHELTHAILRDMDHPLCRNERFVTEFSNRLTKAITTAKL